MLHASLAAGQSILGPPFFLLCGVTHIFNQRFLYEARHVQCCHLDFSNRLSVYLFFFFISNTSMNLA
jgi:hypothetical protein